MRSAFLPIILTVLLICSTALADPQVMSSMDAIRDLCGEGFMAEGTDPVYYKDHEAGRWLYVSDTVRVEIIRYQTKNPLLTWYIADLQVAEGTSLYTLSAKDTTGKANNLPQRIANAGRAVYAQSGDFYSYRVSHKKTTGVIIRNGKTLYKKTYSKKVKALPNLATMAFYSSGRAEVNEAWEMSAKDYINKGAYTVVSFGPILVRSGEVQNVDEDAWDNPEPRCCIGIINRGHYVGLLV